MNHIESYEIFESSDRGDFLKWKRKNVALRGMKNIGQANSGAAGRFGDGLYTAALGNRTMAKNYGDVYLFSSRKLTLNSSSTVSLANDPQFSGSQSVTQMVFDGSAKGMVSRVYYFSYALTYTEIQSLMNVGPSKEIEGPSMNITPYLSDTWWTNPQGP